MKNIGLELSNIEIFPDGSVRSGFPKKEYFFNTEYGKFRAQYTNDGARKQTINSLEFFPDGGLRKISLENQENIDTDYGEIPAELVLFYDTKKIRKIFPLNGRITGYWSEKDEYGLAKELEFNVGGREIKGKFINIEFYETGALKSLLLWSSERIQIEIGGKKVKVKNKISFYEDGEIKSVEPSEAFMLDTPIGKVNIVNGFSSGFGYGSTILFAENGEVKQIQTTSEIFEVLRDKKLVAFIEPELNPSMCNDKVFLPDVIKVEFENKYIAFNGTKFEMDTHEFLIHNNVIKAANVGSCG